MFFSVSLSGWIDEKEWAESELLMALDREGEAGQPHPQPYQ